MSVKPGDVIVDFRAQEWTFVYISKMPGWNGLDYSNGKIIVKDEFGREREFYPSVFDLIITEQGNLEEKDIPPQSSLT